RTLNPADEAGRYTLVLPAESDADHRLSPGGDGIAAGVVYLNGSATFLARLGDGTPVSFGAALSQEGGLCFYRSLYRRPASGWIGGTIQMRESEGLADGDGTLHWVKNARPAETRYAEGFDLQQPVVASRFVAPVRQNGERVLTSLADGEDNAEFTLEGGNLAFEVGTQAITWTAADRFRFQGEVNLSGGSNPRNGWVTGLCFDPGSKQKV
ncbi:MAG: hypothetical protein KDM63_22300, partial [Verrucomicrobiae bacterium]|nr:hypothetical protein [Verrucomicrobiae bacterium]